MEELKRLQDERLRLANEIRALADKQASWTAEDRQQWDATNAAYDECMAKITAKNEEVAAAQAVRDRLDAINSYQHPLAGRIGRDPIDALERGPQNPGHFGTAGAGEDLITALHGWLMSGSELATSVGQQHQAAASRVRQSLNSPVFTLNLDRDWRQVRSNVRRFSDVQNVLSGQTGVDGGFTKDQMLLASLEMAMLAYGGMLNVAEIIRTSNGEPLRWPTVDDTSNTGEQIGESTSHDGATNPTFAQTMWNAYTFSSKIIRTPNELLTDSVFNLASVLGQLLGERLGRIQNTKYTTGNGVGTAKGIVTAATAGVTAASATAIAFDELIDLEHSLDPSRRRMPGVGYMFHDSVLKALRKLKDGEGRYLWQSGANSGAPDTLNTYPFTINQDMASSIASAAVTVLFGQLSAYKVRQVGSITLRRLDERFADTNETGFVALIRGDGNLLDAGDHPVRKLTQA